MIRFLFVDIEFFFFIFRLLFTFATPRFFRTQRYCIGTQVLGRVLNYSVHFFNAKGKKKYANSRVHELRFFLFEG